MKILTLYLIGFFLSSLGVSGYHSLTALQTINKTLDHDTRDSDVVQSPVLQQSGLDITNNTQPAEHLAVEAQLTETQIRLLDALGIEIVIPRYVPVGFRLESVQAKLEGLSSSTYLILFKKYDIEVGKNYCFAIEATYGGIGDVPSGMSSYPIHSQALGNSTLEYGLYGTTSSPSFLGNWLGSGPFYRFVGAEVLPSLSRCENIDVQEAIQVSESLDYL